MEIPSFSSLQQYLDFLLEQGVKRGVFPGGATAVFSGCGRKKKRVVGTSGFTRLDKKGKEVEKSTFFDLASLTKPLATALSFYCLIEQGSLDPDDRLGDVSHRKIPPDKKKITIAHLLSHSSGLSLYRPYFELFRPDPEEGNKKKLFEQILRDPLEYETGTTCLYSDLGFILLGDLVEQVSGLSLDRFFRKNITDPLGLTEELFFLPTADQKSSQRHQFAATEKCGWRNRILQGEVHDEHSFLMGGVAGHAGLFGTINAVTFLCESLLDRWRGRQSALPVDRKFLARALRRRYSGQSWCLGFDTPSSTGYTSSGIHFSEKSIGHLGYAGTSFWIDPDRDTGIVLLSNRVHPTRENTKIREFRPWFHDRILEFLSLEQEKIQERK